MEQTRLVRFNKDDVFFSQGETSREMYIIRSGEVQVLISKQGENIPLVVLGKGSFVGEMSFLSGIPRSATVVAKEPVLASVITTDILRQDIFGLNGWAFSIAKVLVERIRKTTSLLGDYLLAEKFSGNGVEKEKSAAEEFSLHGGAGIEPGRIYLKGYFTEKYVDLVKAKVRELKLKNFSRITLDFSEVIDIDQGGLNYLLELTRIPSHSENKVFIENVQLIKNKVLSIKGIQNIMSTSNLPQRRVEQGELLIREGDMENVMYVVKTGKFEIYRSVSGREVILGHAESGDVVGEMTLIKEGMRSANVRAKQSSIVYVIQIEEFYKNMYHVPRWFMDIIRGLVERLRTTNNMLESIVKNKKKKENQKQWHSPIGIVVDSKNPGKLILQGHLVLENLEYLAVLVNSIIEKGNKTLVIDLNRVKEMDRESIMYLLHLFLDLKRRKGNLHILGPHRDILKLFNQYDVDL
ncbi:MAG: hypothetical protein DRP87_15380 [Spirochaetes bacterium]|nr:MAG: hypothetical protein DRP87_15380 [Spirochaetota bacterium]